MLFDSDYDGVTFNADEVYSLIGSANMGDGVVTSVDGSFTNFSYDLTGIVSGDLGLRITATGFRSGNERVTFFNVTAIPEPGTLIIFGIAIGSLLFFRRRR